MFWREYVERTQPWELIHFHADGVDETFHCRASARYEGKDVKLTGQGNGPIAAFVHALHDNGTAPFEIADFRQHTLGDGAEASAIAYIRVRRPDGVSKWGAGVDTNIELASIKAVLSAVNRAAAG